MSNKYCTYIKEILAKSVINEKINDDLDAEELSYKLSDKLRELASQMYNVSIPNMDDVEPDTKNNRINEYNKAESSLKEIQDHMTKIEDILKKGLY